ncbi:MAG TPA: transglycosylase domain-containing protein [Kineosporiaceae bacterium]|nr:transglycosylase domain-containing protein [Kineosporiaceae bacterium]
MNATRPDLARGTFRVLFLLAVFVVISVLSGGLASGLVMPALSATSAAVNGGVSFFDSLPSALTEPPLMQTTRMLAANGAPIAYFYDENRVEIPLDKVAPVMQAALVAIEDSRFFQHGGIDVRGVVRAAVNNEAGRSTQGASTLTQQYVKNVLLEQAVASGDRVAAQNAVAKNTARKLREMKIAITIEQKLTKPQVLERYLNIASFGEQTYGVEAASLLYFGIHASELDLAQAATLAGMVQEPSTNDPRLHPETARARRDVVLARMLQLGVVKQADYQKAHDEPIKVTGKPLPNGCANAGNYGYFCDYVLNVLEKSPDFTALGSTPVERKTNLMRGGYTITTTVDPRVESVAVRSVFDAIPPTDSSGLATAAVTVEPGTGKIISMAQDRAYSVKPGRGMTSVNYSTDTAFGGSSGFQTGSSFKPFTLAAWLAAGHSLNESVDATQRDFPFSDFTACGSHLSNRGAAPYAPGNSEGRETGQMSVLDATVNSVNVAYVDMESQLDLCDIAGVAEGLGVHLAAPDRTCKDKATQSLPTCLPSLTLGVLNIAPLTMAAAYAGFASGGIYCEPMAVTGLAKPGSTPGSSADLKVPGSRCKRALDTDVASGVSTALQQVLSRGTAANVGPLDPWPSAGKTGTTDGPKDTWFVGYTAQRSTAVWVADPGRVVEGKLERETLKSIRVDGSWYGTVFGASIAAPIWKNVMNEAMAELPAKDLP